VLAGVTLEDTPVITYARGVVEGVGIAILAGVAIIVVGVPIALVAKLAALALTWVLGGN
jgi:hypothetical protein